MNEIDKVNDNVDLTINGFEFVKNGELINPHIPKLVSIGNFNLKISLENNYDIMCKSIVKELNDKVDVNVSDSNLSINKNDTTLHIKNPNETLKKIQKKYSTNTLRSIIDDNSSIKPPIKMVNSNAYELREMILKNSIDVVLKYSKSDNLDNIIDDIMKTSEKFYNFVENKRKC